MERLSKKNKSLTSSVRHFVEDNMDYSDQIVEMKEWNGKKQESLEQLRNEVQKLKEVKDRYTTNLDKEISENNNIFDSLNQENIMKEETNLKVNNIKGNLNEKLYILVQLSRNHNAELKTILPSIIENLEKNIDSNEKSLETINTSIGQTLTQIDNAAIQIDQIKSQLEKKNHRYS